MPASCSRRRFLFAKTAPNARSDSPTPRSIPTVSQHRTLYCELEDELGRFVACCPSRGGQRGRDAHKTSHKEGTEMSDETREDEVEAHRHKHNLANAEPKDEAGDDFEAHRHKHNLANDEGKDDESDDDFEAHRHKLNFRPGHK